MVQQTRKANAICTTKKVPLWDAPSTIILEDTVKDTTGVGIQA